MATYQAFPISFQHELERESWALYTLGILVIALRTFARIRKMSWRGLEIDDYLIFLAAAWYTTLIVTLNLTAQGGGSALAMPGEDVSILTEIQIKLRERGAKIDLVAEQSMLNVIWTLKVCMLLLYNRLTMGLRQHLAVKAIAIYVAVGYVACQLAFFCECIPFSQYWQIVPSPPRNCMVLYDYAIVQGIFNISSDLFMMLVPLPLILQVSVPLKQKVILLVIFSMGIFVIVAAALTKAEFFISVYADSYMFWYTREASVAVYVANLPCIWPLLREALPVLKSWTPGFVSSNMYKRRHPHGTHGGTVTSTGPMTRGLGTRTNVTRHSLDEFQKIVEGSAISHATSTTTKSTGETGVREVRPYRSRIEAGGNGTGHDRGSSSSSLSNDSSSIEMVFADGIRAETTIEMSVLEAEEGNHTYYQQHQSHLHPSTNHQRSRDLVRPPQESHSSSTLSQDYNNHASYDLEKGIGGSVQPRSGV
ncbi:hypothetical protein AAFC00_006434 [Neodothiora populina]|uniref:Rhodopsin domain-containing protein n=1 Tax=Neodothiora populina TaxID=2781224 RepID=A0ABR3P6K1_9PEZI